MKGKLKGSKIMALTLSAIIALPSVAYAATEAHVLKNPTSEKYTQFDYLAVRGSYNEYKNTDDPTKGIMYRAYKDGGELVGIFDDQSRVYIDYYKLLDEYTKLREQYPNATLEDRQKIVDGLKTFQEEKVQVSDQLKSNDGTNITIEEIDSKGKGNGTIIIDNTGQAQGIKSVTVTPNTATIPAKGGQQQFIATVDVLGAAPKTVTWSLTSESPITSSTINQDGLLSVDAADAGKTIIVKAASTATPLKFGTATVTVEAAPAAIAVTGVTVDPTTLTLTVGDETKLTATVAPANATNPNVTWSSTSSAAVSVATDGTVTALAAGQATITVTTVDGGKTATCIVTVEAPVSPVTAMRIVSTPTKKAYLVNDALDLTGLEVELTREDETKENVTFANFTAKGLTTTVANGATLTDQYTITINAPGGQSVSLPIEIWSVTFDQMNALGVSIANINQYEAHIKLNGVRFTDATKLALYKADNTVFAMPLMTDAGSGVGLVIRMSTAQYNNMVSWKLWSSDYSNTTDTATTLYISGNK